MWQAVISAYPDLFCAEEGMRRLSLSTVRLARFLRIPRGRFCAAGMRRGSAHLEVGRMRTAMHGLRAAGSRVFSCGRMHDAGEMRDERGELSSLQFLPCHDRWAVLS